MFITATLNEGGEEAAYDAIANLTGLHRSVSFRAPSRDLILQVGIGSDAWDRLFAGPRPAGLHPFIALDGGVHQAPSTPGDFLLHLRAGTLDMCFELAGRILDSFQGTLTVVDEVHGFRFFDSRDLLGFVDGSENPSGAAADRWTTVGDEDQRFAGGNYVIIQKYVHDMSAWNALTVEQQELVIGRRKTDNIELPDDQKPVDAHIVVNTVEDAAGEQQQIVRLNMPFGELGKGEYGTFFIGYSRTPEVTETMLERMFIGEPPGNTDRLLDFSTAETGCLFFTPTDEFLDDPFPFVGPSVTIADEPTPTAPAATGDGALTIGSLKGMN